MKGLVLLSFFLCAAFSALTVVRPGDPNYRDEVMSFNRLSNSQPAPKQIFFPETAEDVSNILRNSDKGKGVAVRAGRHSYTLSSSSDNIIIDVGRLKSVAIDANRQLAVVGTGNKNYHIQKALNDKGFMIPIGTCPSVGAGFFMGGGYSLFSRMLGMGVDAVLGFQVVLADGSIVIADQNQNSDLFWALRGGGAGSFGVVTSVTLKISPVPQTVSLMRFEWADGAKALPVWERFLLDNFNNEKLTPQGYTNSKGGARANVFYVGPLVELQRLVAPLKAAGPTVSLSEKSVPYISIVHQFGGCKDPATVPANDPTNCMNFAATTPKANPGTASTQEKQSPWVAMSAYVSKEIGANGWAAIMSKLKTLPGIMIIIDPHGAKINSVPADATSYSHRGALYHFQIIGYFEQEAARAGRQNSVQALYEFVVQLGVTSGSYINYSNEAMLQKPNWGRLYYGSGFERLQQIKAKYDPGNVFRHKFSIPVPGGSAPEVQPSQPSAPTTGSNAVNVPSCNAGEPAVFSLVEVASGANPRLPTRVTVCTEGPALRVDFVIKELDRVPALASKACNDDVTPPFKSNAGS